MGGEMLRYISVTIMLLFSVVMNEAGNAEMSKEERKMARVEIMQTMHIPDGVDPEDYVNYLAKYGPEWGDHTVKGEKPLKLLKNFFKNTPYRTIWYWDIDGDGLKDYLCVEVYPKIRRGIKRGILVDEQGTVKLYIDTDKGVYTKDSVLLNLKKLGHMPGEVACYSIGYIPYHGKGDFFRSGVGATKEVIERIKEKYGNTRIFRSQIGAFSLQRIDKDLYNIGADSIDQNAPYRASDGFFIDYNLVDKRSEFELFNYFYLNNEQIHEKKNFFLKKNREAKKQGQLFRVPEKLNKSDIKKALKIVTEIGLYN